MPEFAASSFAFITPDNCLVDLRRQMIAAGKSFVMSTYGIYRGFLLMEAGMVPPGAELYAAWLDGMEHFARPISLEEIARRGRFDFMVTGASAVSVDGVRFGKGHGFLIWNGICSPIWGWWMRQRPWWPWSTTARWSRKS